MQRHWIFLGAIFAGLAVGLGAFGAHGLEDFLKDRHAEAPELFLRRMDNWGTAALYQMHHALGLIAVGLIALSRPSKWLNVAGWCFFAGILFFSGSLYALVLTEIKVLGAITPLGGVSFILGWIALATGGCCLSDRLVQIK
ncbi:MAG: DUF423 domain-containing protein [Mariniblastus sp.]|nr:DUF423 domain-containing protein [Mariniblastus sp.]